MTTKNNSDQHKKELDVETQWQQIKDAYRNTYPTLTEDDTTYRDGEFDDMTHRMARRTNRTREQIVDEIINWVNS